MTLPEYMNALVQAHEGAPLQVKKVKVPQPGPGEVLVKMDCSPVNPSDLATLEASYAEKPEYPLTPGIEGSGTVVAAGKGLLPRMRLGKRVSCSSSKGKPGLWAEYACTSAMRCIPLKKHVGMQEGASLIVNPLTALAFIDIAKKDDHKAILNTAAASALGKMLVRLAAKEGITLLNIVRRKEQAEALREIGAKHVLISEEKNFETVLKDTCENLNIRLAFDAVSGSMTPLLLKAMPPNSQLYIYAKLDPEHMLIDQREIIQQGKEIKGFFLGAYTSGKGILKSLGDVKRIQKMLGEEIQTPIHKSVSLEEVPNAIEEYKQAMSKGKILIHLNQD